MTRRFERDVDETEPTAEQHVWAACPTCNCQIAPEFLRDFGGCQRHVQRLPEWLSSWRGVTRESLMEAA